MFPPAKRIIYSNHFTWLCVCEPSVYKKDSNCALSEQNRNKRVIRLNSSLIFVWRKWLFSIFHWDPLALSLILYLCCQFAPHFFLIYAFAFSHSLPDISYMKAFFHSIGSTVMSTLDKDLTLDSLFFLFLAFHSSASWAEIISRFERFACSKVSSLPRTFANCSDWKRRRQINKLLFDFPRLVMSNINKWQQHTWEINVNMMNVMMKIRDGISLSVEQLSQNYQAGWRIRGARR